MTAQLLSLKTFDDEFKNTLHCCKNIQFPNKTRTITPAPRSQKKIDSCCFVPSIVLYSEITLSVTAHIRPLAIKGHRLPCADDYVNAFDKPVVYMCPADFFLAGVQSYHENPYEDRRFKYKCCRTQGSVGCRWHISYSAHTAIM